MASVVKAYCDSAADVNLLFMKRTPEKFGGVVMREQSEDVFKLFTQIATGTGGIAETTQNPVVEVGDALRAAETYYLLSYAPTPAAGGFRTVAIKVKERNYRVLSRQGYITD
jgi:hypothetical protein